ncbi:hypothetical protein ACCO45_006831 [Purpureocillium lilacinum]|uniref:Uncharacterized protein n=1 Tax=Purpureocillium lilacinum TaxID=33203 RepID=A0ACC4DQR8_PURLI
MDIFFLDSNKRQATMGRTDNGARLWLPRLSKPPRARSPLLVLSFARSLVRVVAQNRRRVFTWGSLQCTPDCTHAQWRRSARQTRRVSNSSNGEQQQALKATPAREPHRSRVHLIRGRGPDGGVVIAPMIHPWTAPPIPPPSCLWLLQSMASKYWYFGSSTQTSRTPGAECAHEMQRRSRHSGK